MKDGNIIKCNGCGRLLSIEDYRSNKRFQDMPFKTVKYFKYIEDHDDTFDGYTSAEWHYCHSCFYKFSEEHKNLFEYTEHEIRTVSFENGHIPEDEDYISKNFPNWEEEKRQRKEKELNDLLSMMQQYIYGKSDSSELENFRNILQHDLINPRMYLMSGMSGAGKTTFAKEFAKKNNIMYLGIDDFYAMFNGDEKIHDHEFEVWIMFYQAIHAAEVAGRSVIVDTNSPTRVMRTQFLDWFGDFKTKVLIYMDASMELCQRNNRSRNRVISDKEMEAMAKNLEPVRFDKEDPRWDMIYIMRNKDNQGYSIVSRTNYAEKVEQYHGL